MNKKLIVSFGGAGLLALAAVAGVSAAGPQGGGNGPAAGAAMGGTLGTILNLDQAQVRELRQDGLSLAQIAEQQGVDPAVVVDALTAQWTSQIDVRVTNGALTAEQADALKAQVEARAEAMVNQTEPGGMQGAAVGAGKALMGKVAQGMGALGIGPRGQAMGQHGDCPAAQQ